MHQMMFFQSFINDMPVGEGLANSGIDNAFLDGGVDT